MHFSDVFPHCPLVSQHGNPHEVFQGKYRAARGGPSGRAYIRLDPHGIGAEPDKNPYIPHFEPDLYLKCLLKKYNELWRGRDQEKKK